VEVDAIATELFSLQMLSNSEFTLFSFAKYFAYLRKRNANNNLQKFSQFDTPCAFFPAFGIQENQE